MGRRVAILVRHGDYHQLPKTPSAHQPFPLNDKGMAQAKAGIGLISTMLKDNNWALHPVVHSSNLLRAWQTAETIVDGVKGCETITGTDYLAERGLGSGANLSLKQLNKIIEQDPRFDPLPDDWKSNSHYRLPLMGAESLMEAGMRVANYMASTMKPIPAPEKQDVAVIFVGHGAAFRHAAHHLGVMSFEDIAKLSMHHAQPVALGLQEDGHWNHTAGQWKVRALADQAMD